MIDRSRRQFLEDALFAAAAAATTASGAWAIADEAHERQSKSPNEKLRLAIVGVHGRGKEHIDQFTRRDDIDIVYIVDPDENVGHERAALVGERQGHSPKYVPDMRTAFDDKTVDIVSTATPNHWHALTAIWAMQAGKDMYVEKPVSHNVSEGRRIVETARKYNRICQTGTQCRSNPGMRAAMAYLHEGKLGPITLARGLCYKRRVSIGPAGNYQVPQQIDYDLWLGPAPYAPLTRKNLHYDWHMQTPYGNGDLGNQGIHQMDLARWGLGVDGLSNAVISYGGRFGYEDAGDAANTQIVMHDYGDKSLVFEVRGLETPKYRGMNVGVMFEGRDGYLVMTSYDSGAAFDKQGHVLEQFSGGDDKYHFANFISAVRSRKKEDLNAEILDGHLSSSLCHLGNISYRLGSNVSLGEVKDRLQSIKTNDHVMDTFERTVQHLGDNHVDLSKTLVQFGQWLAIDAPKEKFLESSQADHLLTREYRAPFVVPPAAQV